MICFLEPVHPVTCDDKSSQLWRLIKYYTPFHYKVGFPSLFSFLHNRFYFVESYIFKLSTAFSKVPGDLLEKRWTLVAPLRVVLLQWLLVLLYQLLQTQHCTRANISLPITLCMLITARSCLEIVKVKSLSSFTVYVLYCLQSTRLDKAQKWNMLKKTLNINP